MYVFHTSVVIRIIKEEICEKKYCGGGWNVLQYKNNGENRAGFPLKCKRANTHKQSEHTGGFLCRQLVRY